MLCSLRAFAIFVDSQFICFIRLTKICERWRPLIIQRSKLEIYVDVLKALAHHGPLKPTQLVYKVNISYSFRKRYFDFLVQHKLIQKQIFSNVPPPRNASPPEKNGAIRPTPTGCPWVEMTPQVREAKNPATAQATGSTIRLSAPFRTARQTGTGEPEMSRAAMKSRSLATPCGEEAGPAIE